MRRGCHRRLWVHVLHTEKVMLLKSQGPSLSIRPTCASVPTSTADILLALGTSFPEGQCMTDGTVPLEWKGWELTTLKASASMDWPFM